MTPESDPNNTTAPAPAESNDAVNILLVDDQEKNILALEAILSAPDLNLVRALSGEEALSKMLDHEFALVILDVQMPGMDGFETAQLIRGTRRTKDIPIIFVTAISKEQTYVFQGYEAGAVDYLFKPFDPAILKSKTRIFVDLYKKNRALQRSIDELESARQLLRNQAEELERSNHELEHFAYAVSHDLKEPLRSVYSFLELIHEQYGDSMDEEGRRMVGFAVDGSKRMTRMIDALLEYSRVTYTPPTFESVDCNLVIQEVIQDLQAMIKDTHAEVTHDALPPVKADHNQVKQLLQNLVINGIKFHGEKPPAVHIGCETIDEGNKVRISVRDHGIGIAPKHQAIIFDIFQRLDAARDCGGTGMGLAICKTIAENHGSSLQVESETGDGACFTFTLERV